MASQVSGNLIGALVLKYGGKKTTLFLIFSCLAIAGSMMMCFLRIPKKSSGEREQSNVSDNMIITEK